MVLQVPEFEEAAFSAPINKVVKCKTKFGWHLLQVISERLALDFLTFVSIKVGDSFRSKKKNWENWDYF